MKHLIRLTFALIAFTFSSHTMALDEASTISEDAKRILSSLEKEFKLTNLSPDTKKLIADQFSFALEEDWYSWWIGNNDLDASKFKESKVRVYDLVVANNNRINNITFTYFPEANQIFYVRKQYVEGSSDLVLENYNAHKEKEDTEIKRENNYYAFTKRKGYLDFDIFHVKGKEGMIAYIDGGVIDLK